MRFHVGFSFRLKNLVKFIIPILIGIGAYFGLPVLFGFIPKVNALENYDTSYSLTLPEELPQYFIDDINDNVLSLTSNYNDIVITYYVGHNWNGTVVTDFYANLFVIPQSISQDIYIYYDWRFWIKSSSFSPSIYYLQVRYDTEGSSILDNTNYSAFVDCYVNDVCDSNSLFVNGDIFTANDVSPTPTNDNDVTINTRYLNYYYYSSLPLIISTDSSNVDSNDVFYKTFTLNDTDYGVGDTLPTYQSLYVPLPEPPEPSQEGIVNNIYWFYDNVTEYDVLVNIYTLLFLYCFAMIILKLLMIVKGVKW